VAVQRAALSLCGVEVQRARLSLSLRGVAAQRAAL
jgi:hypothetical protein